MSEQTKIQWADSTLNFWSGCTKVSAGCANCYAETLSGRKLTDAKGNLTIGQWGKGAPRKLHESAFKTALKLNRKPWIGFDGEAFTSKELDEAGAVRRAGFHRRRIFSLSLGDWLDPEVPVEWLARMLDTIRQCDQVTWILCTKRPENYGKRMNQFSEYVANASDETNRKFADTLNWGFEWYGHNIPPKNVILLASVENQAMADKRIPELLRIPAACRGLSLEPLLGPVDLSSGTYWSNGRGQVCDAFGANAHCPHGEKPLRGPGISWLIIGGESGPGARPCNVDWIRSLVAQGKSSGVATFVKQLGANPFTDKRDTSVIRGGVMDLHDLKGGDWNEWPQDLRVREWPKL